MTLGIDIGGTKILAAVFDGTLSTVASWRVPTPGRDYTAFLATLVALVEQADRTAGSRQAVGLARPGLVDRHGRSISVNVPCIHGRLAVGEFEAAIGRPVTHENDLRAFTLSESRGGALDGVRVGVGIVLGTGVGGTLCVDGRLHDDGAGVAGEYGHLALPPHLIDAYELPAGRCPCGATGCAEAVLSGPGLLRAAARRGRQYGSVPRLVADARAGDRAACGAFDAYIDCLGYFVSRLTLLVGPQVVVFGGGLSGIAELYERVPAAATAYLFDGLSAPAITPPTFGPAGGARGAAILAAGAHAPAQVDSGL